MKKSAIAGVILGVILGVVVGLVAGSWLVWLGLGLVIGVMIGSVSARRARLESARVRGELNP